MSLTVHISRQETRADTFCGTLVKDMHYSEPNRQIWIQKDQVNLYPVSSICAACLEQKAKEEAEPHPSG